MADAIELNCGIWKAKEDKTPKSPLVVGGWRAEVYGLIRLRGPFVIRVLQFYSLVNRFRLGGSWRGFLLNFFGFLFDNTS